MQPGECGDTIVDSVDNQPYWKGLRQHLAGRLAVPGASPVNDVNVLMDSWSGITAISEELLQALQGQPGTTQTALTQMFAGHARVLTSLGPLCIIETQSCALHLMIETPWGTSRLTMPFIVLPGGGDVVVIGQKTLRENLGIDVMAPLKATVLKACGRQDGARVELTAHVAGELNAGAVLRAAMAVTAFGPTGDAPGDVDVEVILMLPSHRPTIFEDIEVEMPDRVGVLRRRPITLLTVIFCRKVPRCCVIPILARTMTCFRRACLGDPPARMGPTEVRFS